jgi:hypothetical protein
VSAADAAPILALLADCVCEQVAAGAGPVCSCSVYPGGVPAWDFCDSCGEACGQSYIAMASIEPYTTFGSAQPAVNCAYGLQMTVNVGTVRCFPVHEDGSPPTPEEMAEVSATLAADADAMLRAVECCLPADRIVVGYQALPAQGGCVGGQWTVVVDLDTGGW